MTIRLLALASALHIFAPPGHAQLPALETVSFDGALGFRIGAPLEGAYSVAQDRGEPLQCHPVDEAILPGWSACEPEIWMLPPDPPASEPAGLLQRSLPGRPPYRLLVEGDSVRTIVLNLESVRGTDRPAVEAHWDRLGTRAAEGVGLSEAPAQSVLWTQPTGFGLVEMECRALPEEEWCTVLISRASSPAEVERSVERFRRFNPPPLGPPEGGPGEPR